MSLINLYTCSVLILTTITANFTLTEAKPTQGPTPTFFDGYIAPSGTGGIERFDYDYYHSPTYGEPLTESRLGRLRRGYYYVDDGFITPVEASAVPTANRRVDAVSDGDNSNVQYTPLVKYQHTRTKHKKLFVPNLFG